MIMNARIRWIRFGLVVAAMLVGVSSRAADAPVQAVWKAQEINYSYVGFTTAYDCDSAAQKIKAILDELGAHPNSKVTANGCAFDRPSRNFFVKITAATAVPVAEASATAADQSKQELLKRLGIKSDISSDEFPAEWTSVDLSKNRRLSLRPGDCELMEGLRDHVLPKLGVKVTEQRLSCTPNQVGITTPRLTVSALVPAKRPDQKPAG
jgi:hypothetical protein